MDVNAQTLNQFQLKPKEIPEDGKGGGGKTPTTCKRKSYVSWIYENNVTYRWYGLNSIKNMNFQLKLTRHGKKQTHIKTKIYGSI